MLLNLRLLVSGDHRHHRHAYDRTFDRKYGVDTAGTVAAEELEAAEELKSGAARYEAADPDFFEFLLQRAELADRDGQLFVDLGAGKGRGLLLAALAGFPRVIGVEMDPRLCGVARRNIEIFKSRCPTVQLELVNGDASSFDFPPVPTVLFLNNPFNERVLEKVLANVEQGHRATRRLVLIYMHSNHADTIRGRSGWEQIDQGTFRSRRHFYEIFRWRGARLQDDAGEQAIRAQGSPASGNSEVMDNPGG
jgi:predicted RNA methylase